MNVLGICVQEANTDSYRPTSLTTTIQDFRKDFDEKISDCGNK